MKHIGNLKYAEGSRQKKKRIGRGQGSGHGGTSTRGHKGQQSRSGYSRKFGFEGGQMPINRRLPKFGFNNHFRVEYQVVNVGRLQELADNNKLKDNNNNEIENFIDKYLNDKEDLVGFTDNADIYNFYLKSIISK